MNTIFNKLVILNGLLVYFISRNQKCINIELIIELKSFRACDGSGGEG